MSKTRDREGERAPEPVLALLPLRFPYLLIDRVLERGPERARALKNVSHNEWVFAGHFPGRPVLPGTLILEGMAQTAGLLLPFHAQARGQTTTAQSLGFLVGVDKARFRRPVVPGDRLVYEARLERAKAGLLRAAVLALVEGERVAEAEITLMAAREEDLPES